MKSFLNWVLAICFQQSIWLQLRFQQSVCCIPSRYIFIQESTRVCRKSSGEESNLVMLSRGLVGRGQLATWINRRYSRLGAFQTFPPRICIIVLRRRKGFNIKIHSPNSICSRNKLEEIDLTHHELNNTTRCLSNLGAELVILLQRRRMNSQHSPVTCCWMGYIYA